MKQKDRVVQLFKRLWMSNFEGKFTIVTNLNTYYVNCTWRFGKRSNLDIKLKRSFIQKQSHWLGVKAHYKLDFQKIMLVYIILKDIVVFLR
jgi:hypothetical protein